ncbi:MFS transporter [Streptomyces sp. NPDC046866]|uniref:MFS transporter n=1 Tax=Streptomyces sp. NPDC046866 TaxID=3154921 RepID=UPI003453D4EE
MPRPAAPDEPTPGSPPARPAAPGSPPAGRAVAEESVPGSPTAAGAAPAAVPAPGPLRPVPGAPAPDRAVRRAWGAVIAVALGIFCLITSELLPVGLLTPVGDAFGVSDGTAGLMVTVPGLVAGCCAPLVAVGAGRRDRRFVLCGLIALMAAANLAAALAQDFAVVLAARLLVGIGIGGFWALAGGIAVRLVPDRHVGRATALVFGGVPAASVLGVPAGTLLGELDGLGGWRAAFGAVGLLGLVALTALLLLLPPLPPSRAVTFRELPALLRGNGAVRAGVVVTFLVVTGQFAAYTFVRPVLQEVSGIDAAHVGTLLLGYGAAGVVGNFLAGTRDAHRTLLAVSAALTVVLALIATLAGAVAGTVLLPAWGLVYGGVSVSLQRWMLTAAPAAAEAATSLMVAVFNLAIAAGALAGGVAVDRIGAAAAPLTGAALMLLGALTVTLTVTVRVGGPRAADGRSG